MSTHTQQPLKVAHVATVRQDRPPHCEGEPTITPFRFSSYGSAYAVRICACGEQMEYVELERGELSE